MSLKQEKAADDSAGVIEDIASMFRAMNLINLSNHNIYLGIPFSNLENFRNAIRSQRDEDEKKRFKNRLRYAGIYKERTENTFKWDEDAYPCAEPGVIENALSIEFIRQRKNLVAVGPPGVGKTMLAVIIACKALRDEFSVKYKTAHDIAVELQEAKDGNSLSGYIKKLQACDVLVIEDLTFATFDQRTAQAFHSIIDGRYDRKTTIITSNGNIKNWALEFPDKRMSSALLGRIYEEALLINMNGAEDMRLKRAKAMLDNSRSDIGGET
jgi:DNA replication protein DnaC